MQFIETLPRAPFLVEINMQAGLEPVTDPSFNDPLRDENLTPCRFNSPNDANSKERKRDKCDRGKMLTN